MKRKKPTPRRTRRSPYERSLDYATKRLEKAIVEEKDCQLRLAALHKEIPYLQTVIRALTPVTERVEVKRDKYAPSEPFTGLTVPDHLKKFVTQVAGNYPPPITLPDNPTEDDFIPDAIPGTEVLP